MEKQQEGDGVSTEELRQIFKQFRDEELEHLDHAVANEAKQAPLYEPLTQLIQTGCRAAIWISERV